HDAATSGEEFSFMKDFLPEGEEAEGSEPLFPADEEAEEAPGALGGDEESDLEDIEPEPTQITVEDLRKAPDEYRGLPGPDGEPPAVVIEPEGVGAGTEGEVFAVRPEEEEEEIAAVEIEGLRVRPAEGAGARARAAEEEPPPGGVEAAAEHFAEAIRQS